MNADYLAGHRVYITKSRSNHYTVTLRSRATGELVHRIKKLPNIHAARQAVAKFDGIAAAHNVSLTDEQVAGMDDTMSRGSGVLEFYPSLTDGTHIVLVTPDREIHQVGVLWD